MGNLVNDESKTAWSYAKDMGDDVKLLFLVSSIGTVVMTLRMNQCPLGYGTRSLQSYYQPCAFDSKSKPGELKGTQSQRKTSGCQRKRIEAFWNLCGRRSRVYSPLEESPVRPLQYLKQVCIEMGCGSTSSIQYCAFSHHVPMFSPSQQELWERPFPAATQRKLKVSWCLKLVFYYCCLLLFVELKMLSEGQKFSVHQPVK